MRKQVKWMKNMRDCSNIPEHLQTWSPYTSFKFVSVIHNDLKPLFMHIFFYNKMEFFKQNKYVSYCLLLQWNILSTKLKKEQSLPLAKNLSAKNFIWQRFHVKIDFFNKSDIIYQFSYPCGSTMFRMTRFQLVDKRKWNIPWIFINPFIITIKH